MEKNYIKNGIGGFRTRKRTISFLGLGHCINILTKSGTLWHWNWASAKRNRSVPVSLNGISKKTSSNLTTCRQNDDSKKIRRLFCTAGRYMSSLSIKHPKCQVRDYPSRPYWSQKFNSSWREWFETRCQIRLKMNYYYVSHVFKVFSLMKTLCVEYLWHDPLSVSVARQKLHSLRLFKCWKGKKEHNEMKMTSKISGTRLGAICGSDT